MANINHATTEFSRELRSTVLDEAVPAFVRRLAGTAKVELASKKFVTDDGGDVTEFLLKFEVVDRRPPDEDADETELGVKADAV